MIAPPHAPIELPIVDQPQERSDAAANRRRILTAARQLIACEGAAGMSMNAVAAAAGVGKGTIFRRFGDRDGLTEALLDESTVELQNAFLFGPPPLGPGSPASKRLEAFIVALLRFQNAHLELVLAAERWTTRAPPPYATFLIHVSALVEEIDPSLDAPVVAGLILNSIHPEIMARLRRDRGTSLEQLESAAVSLLRGLTGRRS
ncbi:MAG: TetR family transcriptional regulator [Solirubrobacteraceae bacterium]